MVIDNGQYQIMWTFYAKLPSPTIKANAYLQTHKGYPNVSEHAI